MRRYEKLEVEVNGNFISAVILLMHIRCELCGPHMGCSYGKDPYSQPLNMRGFKFLTDAQCVNRKIRMWIIYFTASLFGLS